MQKNSCILKPNSQAVLKKVQISCFSILMSITRPDLLDALAYSLAMHKCSDNPSIQPLRLSLFDLDPCQHCFYSRLVN